MCLSDIQIQCKRSVKIFKFSFDLISDFQNAGLIKFKLQLPGATCEVCSRSWRYFCKVFNWPFTFGTLRE